MSNIEMVIDSIRVSLMNYQKVVILREKNGERYLPIWIDPGGADSIAVKMQNVHVPRPLTHDFVCAIINTLGSSVRSAIVDKLEKDTFHAKLVITVNEKEKEVDCRPSDALAVAVREGIPIFVNEKVLNKVGILLDPETGMPFEPSSETTTAIGGKSDKRSLEIFSESVQDILNLAESEAKRLNHSFVCTGHLLLALTREANTATEILKSADINLDRVPLEIETLIKDNPNIEGSEAGLTPAVKKTIEASITEAKRLGSPKVLPEHILLGLVRADDGIAINWIRNVKIDPETVYIQLIRLYTRPWHEQ